MANDILKLQEMEATEDVSIMKASTGSVNCKNSSHVSLFIC